MENLLYYLVRIKNSILMRSNSPPCWAPVSFNFGYFKTNKNQKIVKLDFHNSQNYFRFHKSNNHTFAKILIKL